MILGSHIRDRAYRLRNRSRLANAAGLDDNIIELARGRDFGKLLHQIHLKRAAYAAILKSHKVALVFFAYHTALLDERRVDIHLADIIDNHCKAYALPVGENTVEKSCLATA